MPETHFFSWITFGLPVDGLEPSQWKTIRDKLEHKARISFEANFFEGCNSKKQAFERIIDYYNQNGIDTFLEKTPRHIFAYHQISELYPDALFLCMVREPKNTVSSFVTMVNPRRSVVRGALLYNKVLSELDRIRDFNNVQVVYYENLTSETEATLQSIAKFIGSWLKPDRLDLLPEMASSMMRPHEHWKYGSAKHDTVYRNEETRWQAVLTPNEAALVDFITHRYASKHGYKPSINTPRAMIGLLRDLPRALRKKERHAILSRHFG